MNTSPSFNQVEDRSLVQQHAMTSVESDAGSSPAGLVFGILEITA